jgi:YHS domain-containing protein
MLPDEVIDPVCGMTILKAEAPHQRVHEGTTYYMCSAGCAHRFDLDGDAYATTAKLNLPGWGKTPHPQDVIKHFRRGDGTDSSSRAP